MIFPPNGKTLKEKIVHALSQQWPLTAKRLYNIIKKDSNVSYQAVYKALNELKKENVLEKNIKNYQLNKIWIENASAFFKELAKYYMIKNEENISAARIKVYKTPEEFYKNLIRLCRKEKSLCLSSKTPALVLTKEKTMSELRKKYVKTLRKRFNKKVLETKYLFSTELTKKLIVKEKDIEAIKNLKKLSKIPNLQLKHAPLHTVITQAIGEKEWIIGLASPAHTDLAASIHFISDSSDFIRQVYDSIFSNAFNVNEFISDVEKKLRN